MSNLRKHYQEVVAPKLMQDLKCKSVMQVPKITKIVINCGAGEAAQNSKVIENVQMAITAVSAQKPIITKAKKSISNFKLREGMPIGCMVTLRGKKMYDFMERLVNIALPRVRDFQGIPTKGFDGHGNYTMGVKESSIFPEVNTDKLDKDRGFDITFVTSAATNEDSQALLKELGLPFRKK